jgi:hypothetical protein
LEGLVGEGWVAGAEDQAGLTLDAELLVQCRLHVDFAEDAEAFALELFADTVCGLGEVDSVVVLSV